MKKLLYLFMAAFIILTVIVTDSYSWFSSGQISITSFEHSNNVKAKLLNLDSVDNTPLTGAVFELSSSNGAVLGRYETDKNGIANLGRISSNETYSVTEISTVYGYEPNKAPFAVTSKKNELVIKSKRNQKSDSAIKIKSTISTTDYAEKDYAPSQSELDLPFEYTVKIGHDDEKSYQYEIRDKNEQLILPYSFTYENGKTIAVASQGKFKSGYTLYLRSGETASVSFDGISPLDAYEITAKNHINLSQTPVGNQKTSKINGYITSTTNSFGHIPVKGVIAEFSYCAVNDSTMPSVASLTVMNKTENADESDYMQEFLTTVEIGLDKNKQYHYEIVKPDFGTNKDDLLLSNGNVIRANIGHNSAIKIYDIPIGTSYKVSQELSNGYFVLRSSNAIGNVLPNSKATVYNTRLFEKSKSLVFDISHDTDKASSPPPHEVISACIIDIKSGISYKEFSFFSDEGFVDKISLPIYEYKNRHRIDYGVRLNLPDGYSVSDGSLTNEALLINYSSLQDSVHIGIRNTVSGLSPPLEEFIYDIRAVKPNTPLPPIDTSTRLVGEGIAFFNELRFYPKGIDGKRLYKYLISQRNGNKKGFSYDEKTYQISVEVTEKADKCYAQIVEIKGGSFYDGLLLFENMYKKDETPELSELIVRKIVESKKIDFEQDFNFTALIGEVTHEFTLSHGETKTFDSLPVGTPYKIFEEENKGYKTEVFGAEGTIEKDSTVAVFINTPIDKPPIHNGSLTIYKELYGNESDEEQKFRFTVTIDGVREQIFLQGGESITFSNLKKGVPYAVAEKDYSDDGYKTLSFNSRGRINEFGNTALFVNIKKPIEKSFLSVTNEVWEGDKEKQFEYTAKIGDEEHSFLLSDGESRLFDDIPVNTPYSILQKDYSEDGYFTKGFAQNGVILPEGIDARFVNIKYLDNDFFEVPIENKPLADDDSAEKPPSKNPSDTPSKPNQKDDEPKHEITYHEKTSGDTAKGYNTTPAVFGAVAAGISATWIYAFKCNEIKTFLKTALSKIKKVIKKLSAR